MGSELTCKCVQIILPARAVSTLIAPELHLRAANSAYISQHKNPSPVLVYLRRLCCVLGKLLQMVFFTASMLMTLAVINQISTPVLAQNISCVVKSSETDANCMQKRLTSVKQVSFAENTQNGIKNL